MRRGLLVSMATLALLVPCTGQQDDFKREGNEEARAKKDVLEGKAPPKLDVSEWMNSKGALTLASLKGKVVVLDFWGVW